MSPGREKVKPVSINHDKKIKTKGGGDKKLTAHAQLEIASVPAFLLAPSMAVILELCSLQAPSFKVWNMRLARVISW